MNCADKVFPTSCLAECAAGTNWDLQCRELMCSLVPDQPNNDHCTHAFGVNERRTTSEAISARAVGRPNRLGARRHERSDGKPKLRLEKTVSKSVSSEAGSGLVQITFSSHLPELGMVKLARPS